MNKKAPTLAELPALTPYQRADEDGKIVSVGWADLSTAGAWIEMEVSGDE